MSWDNPIKYLCYKFNISHQALNLFTLCAWAYELIKTYNAPTELSCAQRSIKEMNHVY